MSKQLKPFTEKWWKQIAFLPNYLITNSIFFFLSTPSVTCGSMGSILIANSTRTCIKKKQNQLVHFQRLEIVKPSDISLMQTFLVIVKSLRPYRFWYQRFPALYARLGGVVASIQKRGNIWMLPFGIFEANTIGKIHYLISLCLNRTNDNKLNWLSCIVNSNSVIILLRPKNLWNPWNDKPGTRRNAP